MGWKMSGEKLIHREQVSFPVVRELWSWWSFTRRILSPDRRRESPLMQYSSSPSETQFNCSLCENGNRKVFWQVIDFFLQVIGSGYDKFSSGLIAFWKGNIHKVSFSFCICMFVYLVCSESFLIWIVQSISLFPVFRNGDSDNLVQIWYNPF